MPDNDDKPKSDDPKDLRNQLETALKKLNEKDATIAQLQGTVLMPNLSDRQRRIVLRELAEEKKEPTAEAVKEVATDLGFKMEGSTTTTATTQNGDGGQNNGSQNQNEGDGKSGDTTTNQDSAGSTTDLPPEVLVALEAMGHMDLVQRYSDRGPDHDLDFESKMKEAKTPEELTAIIRQDGARHGLVHSWDVE